MLLVQSEWIETVQFIDNEAESESAAIAHATLYSARECGDGDANPNDHSHHHQIMIVGHGPVGFLFSDDVFIV